MTKGIGYEVIGYPICSHIIRVSGNTFWPSLKVIISLVSLCSHRFSV